MKVTDTTSETQDDMPTRQRSSRSRSAAVNESMASIELEIAKPQTPQRMPQAPAASSPPVEDDSPLSSVIKALERAASEMKKSHSIPTVTILNKIYAGYSVPGYQKYSGSHKVPIIEIIHFNVHALLDRLDKQRFTGTEFWSWLQELSTKELKLEALKPSDLPFTLAPRKSLNKPRVSLRDSVTVQANKQLEDASEDESIARPPRTGKGLGKGLKTPQTRKPGKSSLRPSTASRKRFYSQIESDEEDSDAAVKRSHYFSDDDSSMEDSGDLSIHKDEPIKLVLRADRIPSATPQSANGTWACEEDDCDYVVRGGDEKECQERIQQHFKDHEQQIQRVELTLTEGNRGHQSIKYAYFPPFLLLFPINSPPAPQTTPFSASLPISAPPTTVSSSNITKPTPTRSASSATPNKKQKLAFRTHLHQFRRAPHSVSDRIAALTKFQPSSREDQEARRKLAERHSELRGRFPAAAADQEETDSMTE